MPLQVATRKHQQQMQQLDAQSDAALQQLRDLQLQHTSLESTASNAAASLSRTQRDLHDAQVTAACEKEQVSHALSSSQQREQQLHGQVQSLERQVEELSDQLHAEQAIVQTLQQKSNSTVEANNVDGSLGNAQCARDLDMTLEHLHPLLDKQQDPSGECSAISKLLQSHAPLLRSVFLYYCLLDTASTDHWPPVMRLKAWCSFCSDTTTADTEMGARRPTRKAGILSGSRALEAFEAFAATDSNSVDGKVLSLEAFQAAVVQLAAWMHTEGATVLSEAFRNFLLQHVVIAKRMQGGMEGAGDVHVAKKGRKKVRK